MALKYRSASFSFSARPSCRAPAKSTGLRRSTLELRYRPNSRRRSPARDLESESSASGEYRAPTMRRLRAKARRTEATSFRFSFRIPRLRVVPIDALALHGREVPIGVGLRQKHRATQGLRLRGLRRRLRQSVLLGNRLSARSGCGSPLLPSFTVLLRHDSLRCRAGAAPAQREERALPLRSRSARCPW